MFPMEIRHNFALFRGAKGDDVPNRLPKSSPFHGCGGNKRGPGDLIVPVKHPKNTNLLADDNGGPQLKDLDFTMVLRVRTAGAYDADEIGRQCVNVLGGSATYRDVVLH